MSWPVLFSFAANISDQFYVSLKLDALPSPSFASAALCLMNTPTQQHGNTTPQKQLWKQDLYRSYTAPPPLHGHFLCSLACIIKLHLSQLPLVLCPLSWLYKLCSVFGIWYIGYARVLGSALAEKYVEFML